MGSILIDPSRCTGCRYCQVASNFAKRRLCTYESFCIDILRNDRESLYVPKICMHCEDAPCMSGCPEQAIVRDKETNAVIIEEAICNGCGLCSELCPYSIPKIDENRGIAVKCNLCHGEPYCVRYCATEALTFND